MRCGILVLIAALAAGVVTTPAPAQTGDVDVQLDQFGVGGYFRPGEFTAVRLRLDSRLDEPTRVWVQIEVPNPDGDIAEYGRSITLNRGQSVKLWIYVPLPGWVDPGTVFPVRVFEEREGRRRGEIGGTRISPPAAGVVSRTSSMLAVVGPSLRDLQLTDYSSKTGFVIDRPPSASEDTRIVFGLKPDDVPDRWEGLKGFEAVAWSDYPPRDLRDEQVDAIRQYIQRGGHLIIVLPEAGNPWGLGSEGETRFHDLLPGAPRRDTEVPLTEVMYATSKSKPEELQTDLPVTLHVFKDLLGGEDGEVGEDHIAGTGYRPLIALQDGRVFVVQRTYRFGRLTVVGMDLANRQLLAQPEAFQADVFWNRVLGRRVDTPSGTELTDIRQSDMLSSVSPTDNNLGGGGLFAQVIAMSEQAGRGLLAVVLLFLLYWIVAGPGGFQVLKQYRLERHSWLAFAASAGLFTAAAWGIVAVIKPSSYRLKHLTYLDMIGGQDQDPDEVPLQRAVSWFSLNMPGYRRTSILIKSDDEQRDLLAAWAPPDLPTQPFPNPDRYRVDVGSDPADYDHFMDKVEAKGDFERPSRATATQLYTNWLGGLTGDWNGKIIRSNPDDPVRLDVDEGGNEYLRGSIINELPGRLRNVTITWVKNARLTKRTYQRDSQGTYPWVNRFDSGQMLNTGGMWKLGEWKDQTTLDLAAVTKEISSLRREIDEGYVKAYLRSYTLPGGPSSISESDRDRYLEMLGFYNMLTPPKYLNPQPGAPGEESVAFARSLGRELDLSLWYTGPCLIVTGQLWGADLPIPLMVNDEAPETDGRSLTVVRWICPLRLVEQIAFRDVFENEENEEEEKP